MSAKPLPPYDPATGDPWKNHESLLAFLIYSGHARQTRRGVELLPGGLAYLLTSIAVAVKGGGS